MQKITQNITLGYLTLLVMIKMLALPLVCIQFDLSKEFLATTLCENKDKPQMKCSGKCLLGKKLHASGDLGKPDAQKTSFSIPSTDFFEESALADFRIPGTAVIPHVIYQGPHTMVGFPGNIFHPPIFA